LYWLCFLGLLILALIPRLQELEAGPLKMKVKDTIEKADELTTKIEAESTYPEKREGQAEETGTDAPDIEKKQDVVIGPSRRQTAATSDVKVGNPFYKELSSFINVMAAFSPEAAIVQQWNYVEARLRSVASIKGYEDAYNPTTSPLELIQFFRLTGVFDAQLYDLTKFLFETRNFIEKTSRPDLLDVELAKKYVDASATVLTRLNNI
jgi:hypothetical protein